MTTMTATRTVVTLPLPRPEAQGHSEACIQAAWTVARVDVLALPEVERQAAMLGATPCTSHALAAIADGRAVCTCTPVAPVWPEGEDVTLMSPAMIEDATAAAQVRAMVMAETRTEAPEAIARALTNRLAHLSTVSEQYATTVYLAHLRALRCARGILAATGGCDPIMREAMREALADVEAAHGIRLHYSPADLAAVLD